MYPVAPMIPTLIISNLLAPPIGPPERIRAL